MAFENTDMGLMAFYTLCIDLFDHQLLTVDWVLLATTTLPINKGDEENPWNCYWSSTLFS